MATMEWNVNCTIICPKCGEEEWLDVACASKIYAGSEGVEVHETEELMNSNGERVLRDDLISWLCTKCNTVSGIEIQGSWDTPYTLRPPKEHITSQVSFLENMTPASVRVGTTHIAVETVERYKPLYGKDKDTLFGQPPYGVWTLRFVCGRGQIEVWPAHKNLDEIEGDFLRFFVSKLDKWSNEAFCAADKSHALRDEELGLDRLDRLGYPTERVGYPLPAGLLASAAFKRITVTESAIRQIIWQRLQDAFGSETQNWWKGTLAPDLREKLQTRAREARDPRHEKHKPVEFLTTGELKSLMNEKWDKAFAQSGVSRERLNASFVRFEGFRNQIAHGRPITYKDYRDAMDASERLTELLNDFISARKSD